MKKVVENGNEITKDNVAEVKETKRDSLRRLFKEKNLVE